MTPKPKPSCEDGVYVDRHYYQVKNGTIINEHSDIVRLPHDEFPFVRLSWEGEHKPKEEE